jgi:hypothetical protein
VKVYLCARYSRHPEMRQVAKTLEAAGLEVTSRWIAGSHDCSDHAGLDEKMRLAAEDWVDLLAADSVLAFSEGPAPGGRNRGGRHVEFGVALGLGKPLFVVGPRENVFHFLPFGVSHFDTVEAAVSRLVHFGRTFDAASR